MKTKDIEAIVQYNNNKISLREDIINEDKEEYLRAIIRGLFLGSGSINNPENKYHLEIVLNQEDNENELENEKAV